MKEKKTESTRQPANTGEWAKSLIEGKARGLFFRKFIKKVHELSTKHLGPDETLRLFKAIDSKRIEIPSIEIFLFDFKDINDNSLNLYNTCTTVDEFTSQSILYFKRRGETGETNIFIKEFFLALADLLATNNLYSNTQIKEALKKFIIGLITVRDKSPYQIIIIEPAWLKEMAHLGLNLRKYYAVAQILFDVYKELMQEIKNSRGFLPEIKYIYPVYYSARENQINYLISVFGLSCNPTIVKKAIENIPTLGEDTSKLRSSLEYLKSTSGKNFLDIEALILELNRLQDSNFLKRYPTRRSLTDSFKSYGIPKNYYNNYSIGPIFTCKETFEKGFIPYFSEVRIDCTGLTVANIEPLIDAAKDLNLIKAYHNKTKRKIGSLTFKITLMNVEDTTSDFEEFVKNKLQRIHSSTHLHFIMDIFYNKETITKLVPKELITHFRIISDIHADYNQGHGYHFNFGDDFVLNCGDTAGNAKDAGQWIRTYVRQGATIIGNHLGYSSAYPERDGAQNLVEFNGLKHISNTKGSQVTILPALIGEHVKLFSNACSEYQGVIIIGTCLYTDFDLYGKDRREECMAYAKKYMNDFRLPVVEGNRIYLQTKSGNWYPCNSGKTKKTLRTFEPSDHAGYFHYSFGFIKEKVEEYKDKPIVIMTHHAPSPYSISEEYKGSMLNAAFASNLNKFIIKHPQIRLWVHGHIHTPTDYILGETRIACCPFGYNNENNFNLPYEYGLRIPIADVKSQKSWKKILAQDIAKGRIQVYSE